MKETINTFLEKHEKISLELKECDCVIYKGMLQLGKEEEFGILNMQNCPKCREMIMPPGYQSTQEKKFKEERKEQENIEDFSANVTRLILKQKDRNVTLSEGDAATLLKRLVIDYLFSCRLPLWLLQTQW